MDTQSISPGHVVSFGDSERMLHGHLVSALVSISVLFGAMFTAHSVLVQLASEDIGSRILSGIEAVRTDIAQIPIAAGHRIALIESRHQNLIESPFYFSKPASAAHFSVAAVVNSQPLGIFSGAVTVAEQGNSSKGPYFAHIVPPGDLGMPEGPNAASMPDSGAAILSIGEFVRDTLLASSLVASVNGSGIMSTITAAPYAIVERYIRALELWAEGSYSVTESSVLFAYHLGDRVQVAVSNAIPEARDKHEAFVSAWVEESPKVAETIVRSQLLFGQRLIGGFHEVRNASGEVQRLAGASLAQMATGVNAETERIMNVVPNQVKASVSDFLILQPSE